MALGTIFGKDWVRKPKKRLSETLWVRFPLVYMVLLGCLLVTFVLAVPQGLLGLLAQLRHRLHSRGEK